MNVPLCLTALLLVVAGLQDAPSAQPSPTEPAPRLGEVLGAITQGNGAHARDLLRSMPASDSARDTQLRSCMQGRLEGRLRNEPDIADAFTREVLKAYEAYWRRGAAGPWARAPAEAKLLERLRQLLRDRRLADIASAEPPIAARLERAAIVRCKGRPASFTS